MRIRDFPLCADENISPAIIKFLRDVGFDVLDPKISGLAGTTDTEVLRRATSENRVVVTHDRDFGRLAVAQLEPITGIVFLRPGHINDAFTIGSLKAFFESDPELQSPFIVVVERRGARVDVRVRQY